MKIIAFNGSPRKEWNTATLLKDALDGAASKGAGTELVHLYDLDYKGCVSCFSCKLKGGKSYGRCAHQDGLTPVLDRIEEADAVIIGSPVYLGDITGETKSFMERLAYPYLPYVLPPGTIFPKKIKTALIFTMGVPEDGMEKAGYKQRFLSMERLMSRIFGSCETLLSFDAYQFKDYSKYVASKFDPEAKLERFKAVFPKERQKASELGARLAAGPAA